jgi:RNA recognition motif-containing protein
MRVKPFRGNIVVSNLPSELSSAELAMLFDEFGLVLGAKVDRWHDRPGGSQGQIDLAPDTSVDAAIAALNGRLLGSNKISVRRQPPLVKKRAAARAGALPASPPPTTSRPTAHVYEVPPEYAPPTPTRKVVVEYRAPRRVVIPPRSAGTAAR